MPTRIPWIHNELCQHRDCENRAEMIMVAKNPEHDLMVCAICNMHIDHITKTLDKEGYKIVSKMQAT